MATTLTSIAASTSAQLLIAADGTRTSLTIQNTATAAGTLYLGTTSGVTTSLYSYYRSPGRGYIFDGVDGRQAWYGIWSSAASGAADITAITDVASDSNGATIQTYGQLKTTIANWLRPNATPSSDMTSRIPQYIGLAEVMIRREIRAKGLDAGLTTLTITSGVATVPDGLMEVTSMTQASSPYSRILPLPLEQIKAMTPQLGTNPKYFDRVGSSFIFWPANTADANLAYRKSLTPLVNDSDTNWLLLAHPDVLLYGSLIQADRRLIGPRLNEWKEGFAQAMASIQNNSLLQELNYNTQPARLVI